MTKGTDKWVEQVLAHAQGQDLKILAGEVAKIAPKAGIDTSKDDTTLRSILSGTTDIRGILEGLMLKSGTATVLDGGKKTLVPYPHLSESQEIVQTPTGNTLVAATDHGSLEYKAWNEDRVALHSGAEFAAAIDGVGGNKDGKLAAQIIAEELSKNPLNVEAAIQAAKDRMQQLRLDAHSGACFASARVLTDSNGEKSVEVHHAGDTRCVITDKMGTIVFFTEDESLIAALVKGKAFTPDQALYTGNRGIVMNYIAPVSSQNIPATVTHHPLVHVKSGYRIYLFSDGIADNLTDEELVRETKNLTPVEAMKKVSEITTARMQKYDDLKKEIASGEREKKGVFSDGFRSKPHIDNRALVIVDIA